MVLKMGETDFYLASSYLGLFFFLSSINLLLLLDLPFSHWKAVCYMSALYLHAAVSHWFTISQRNKVTVTDLCSDKASIGKFLFQSSCMDNIGRFCCHISLIQETENNFCSGIKS